MSLGAFQRSRAVPRRSRFRKPGWSYRYRWRWLLRLDDSDRGGFREWIVVTYHFAPTVNGCSSENNGRYTVLLEPDQVELTTSGFLATSLLSNFHIAFSQQHPA